MPARDDAGWMSIALEEARRAGADGEVPVGAVLVCGDEIIARDHNRNRGLSDPTAHAEILVLREAARQRADWRLGGCTLYVTLEPCAMCAGALVLSRVDRLVFAAPDPKAGMCGCVGVWEISSRMHASTIGSPSRLACWRRKPPFSCVTSFRPDARQRGEW